MSCNVVKNSLASSKNLEKKHPILVVINKADKKIQELILKLKDDPNLSDIVDRFNRLLVLR